MRTLAIAPEQSGYFFVVFADRDSSSGIGFGLGTVKA